MAKTKSKRWSMKDIKKIKSLIEAAKAAGNDEHTGLKAAAQYFGVTLNSVTLRWGRWLKGQAIKTLKRATTKEPMVRKKRKYTKRKPSLSTKEYPWIKSQPKRKYTKRSGVNSGPKSKADPTRTMTFKITKVNVDLAAGTITVNY